MLPGTDDFMQQEEFQRPHVPIGVSFSLFACIWLLFRAAIFVRKGKFTPHLCMHAANIERIKNGDASTGSLKIPLHMWVVVPLSAVGALLCLSYILRGYKPTSTCRNMSWDSLHERKSFRIVSRGRFISKHIAKQIPEPPSEE